MSAPIMMSTAGPMMRMFPPMKSPTVNTTFENQGGLMPLSVKTPATFGNANVTRNVMIAAAMQTKMIG